MDGRRIGSVSTTLERVMKAIRDVSRPIKDGYGGTHGVLMVPESLIAATAQAAITALRQEPIDSDLPDDPTCWMIVFDDQDRAPEIFSGCGATLAAHRRFEAVRQAWTCRLFVAVAHG